MLQCVQCLAAAQIMFLHSVYNMKQRYLDVRSFFINEDCTSLIYSLHVTCSSKADRGRVCTEPCNCSHGICLLHTFGIRNSTLTFNTCGWWSHIVLVACGLSSHRLSHSQRFTGLILTLTAYLKILTVSACNVRALSFTAWATRIKSQFLSQFSSEHLVSIEPWR